MAAPACSLLAYRLRARGYDVALFSYRSVKHGLEESARRLRGFSEARRAGPVHFVGHSLGGLVILAMLAREPTFAAGRVVLLGSPCNGSVAAAQLAGTPAGRLVLGAALPGWDARIGAQAAARHEVGAIAGTQRLGIGMLLVRLQGANDGVVRVEETRLPGLKDHLVLPVTHSGMLVSAQVADRVAAFLAAGRFAPNGRSL